MAYRPYPNVDRAWNQLQRHYPAELEGQTPEAFRPMLASFAQLRENTRLAAKQAVRALGEYQISTR